MKKVISQFETKPKNIFLLDSFGALLTALLLFFLLRVFNTYFGISKTIIVSLSVIALIFSIYSMLCFFLANNNWQLFLRIIIIANILYCVLTFIVVLNYWNSITLLGILYFLGEIFIILALVYLEQNIYKKSME